MNSYRQNVQGDGVFNAPDLTVDLTIGLSLCGQGQLELRARVSNIGALGVLPGVDVTFFEGTGGSATVLGSDTTTVPLLPGASTVVTLAVTAPTAPTDYSVTVAGNSASLVVAECDPNNNSDDETTAGCPVVN